MKVTEDAALRLARLASQGEIIAQDARRGDMEIGVSTADFHLWRTRSLNALRSLLGDAHPWTQQFERNVDGGYSWTVLEGVGILQGLSQDVEQGLLTSMQNLVAAEVFSDFLEMAEHLVQANHFHAAASLIGAVLEDSLRRLADLYPEAGIKPKDGIDAMNKALVKAGAYNAVMAKRVDVWREVRNAADHGRFEDVEPNDVKDLLEGVTQFVANYVK
ncbi:MAG: DUF4145 domain-containing protein [Chloroflexota bacterium]|nr:DUF4145 domain-containing protein [Chloroflexota bacterium]MDP9470921.1 DUF4145 domain-containing protein [Chloroflexota bacterium]